ncbi:sugar phosphate isomerase/epimerase [Lutimonas vermicola]|uniref:Sugar phosphate isomerase/epimerase n=1 Tax=Lutimonas vermicola TaxID=414288 RepID=A0ABU9L1J3_9FLAO
MKYTFKYQWALITMLLLSSFQLLAQDKFGGLALYTVREDMTTNPKIALEKISDIGYTYIEAAGYQDGKFYGMQPLEFRNTLYDLGLIPISSHQPTVTLENADQMIADVKAAGFRYFVIPIPPMGHFQFDKETRSMNMSEDLELLTNILNTIGKKCKDAGLELLYHNHDFEYKKNAKGIVPIEYFLENTNPEYVNFQMDLFWVLKAGADPVVYFNNYPGRFKLWHVKDMDEEGKFAPVGTGTINFERILKEKDLSGMKFYLVEQDMTFDEEPIEAVKISHGGLLKLGFQ